MLDGEGLHDHAAHRQAHHVGPLHPERVEHRHDIGGHVGERVRDLRRFTSLQGRHHAHHVGGDVGEVGRQADVAVVHADDMEALVHEALAPLGAVVDALAPQSVDEDERRLGRVAEGLVVDLDRPVVRERHASERRAADPTSCKSSTWVTRCGG